MDDHILPQARQCQILQKWAGSGDRQAPSFCGTVKLASFSTHATDGASLGEMDGIPERVGSIEMPIKIRVWKEKLG